MIRRIALVAVLVTACSYSGRLPAEATEGATSAAPSLELSQGWEIQSSCDAKAAGGQISQAGFSTIGWHKTTIPNTVVGTLVDDKTYPDPTYGTNMKNLPGMNYS